MSTAANYNNTSIPYGARLETFSRGVTITSNPGAFTGGTSLGSYVCESITLNVKDSVIRRKDELGGPNGSVGVPDFTEGSMTVQLATSSSTTLKPGDCFTDTFQVGSGAAAESFVVTDADQPESQNDYKKQNIRFLKLY